MSKITLQSAAKINLHLSITGKRADGYHELLTLMCCVDLYDDLTLDLAARQPSVRCTHPDVPQDRSNLAYRAAVQFYQEIRRPMPQMSIDIVKRIPVGAGLGGGSGNAAAVLSGLNQFHDNYFSSSQLARIGKKLGADVPFMLYGKPAWASGIGDRLEAALNLQPFPVLLVYPAVMVSTADVYRRVNFALTKPEQRNINSFFKDSQVAIESILHNDLERVTCKYYPEIDAIKAKLLALGAWGALMSGSGSAVFGIFSQAKDAEKAMWMIKKNAQSKGWQVFSSRIIA